MQRALLRNKLVVKKSGIHGYGVFAEQDIQANEMIEESYFLKIKDKSDDLNDYVFNGKEFSILPLGFGCIFNHSSSPNAWYEFDAELSLMFFRASKLIKKGEEIFISYGNEWFSSRNLVAKEPSLKYKIRHFLSSIRFIIRFGLVLSVFLLMLLLMRRIA